MYTEIAKYIQIQERDMYVERRERDKIQDNQRELISIIHPDTEVEDIQLALTILNSNSETIKNIESDTV